jgi:hypothetical protein
MAEIQSMREIRNWDDGGCRITVSFDVIVDFVGL